MNNRIHRVLKEPLLHFFLVGAILYFVFDKQTLVQPSSETIIINNQKIQNLIDQAANNKDGDLTTQERQDILDSVIDKEVLYHEALRVGLNQDALIRERLIKKAIFYLEGQFVTPKLDQGRLRKFHESRKELYRHQAQLSFEQKLIREEKGQELEDMLRRFPEERQFLSKLRSIQEDTFISSSFRKAGSLGIEGLFGKEFVKSLGNAPRGQWVGPIRSDIGLHAVKIIDVQQSSVLAFEDIQEQVKADYLREEREKWLRKKLVMLRKNYKFTYEGQNPGV